MMRRKPDALKGALDLLVLSALSRGPMHGYAIATHIESTSDELLRVEEGSLYPALHRLEQSGIIAAEWQVTASNRRARVYRLTRDGRKRLDTEREKWARVTKGVARVLRHA
jgi:transcriptional regulator